MTEMAALQMKVDTSSLVQAANDLDNFSKAATRAGTAGGNQSGSMSKMIAVLSSMDTKLSAVVGNLEKMAAVEAKVAAATKAAANDINSLSGKMSAVSATLSTVAGGATAVAVSFNGMARAAQEANAHVSAYQAHLQSLPSRQAQSNAHVEAYVNHINKIPPALDNVTKASNDNAGAMRANTANIAAQFQDVGVTAAMGMNPLMIALQQGTQLSSVFAQTGGSAMATLKGAFLSVISPASLLTIGLVAGAAALIQWSIKAFSASSETDKLTKAIDSAKTVGYAFSDAQSALGGIIDLTTGKISSQSSALRGLARAQLEMIRVTSLRDQATARQTIQEARGENPRVTNRRRFITIRGADLGPTDTQQMYDSFVKGDISSTQVINNLEKMRKAGAVTEEKFIELTQAVANFGVAGENLKIYGDARKALEGDQEALSQFLNPPSAKKDKPKDVFGLSDLIDNASKLERDLKDAAASVGLYGEELDRLQYKQNFLNKAADEGLKLSAKEVQAFEQKAKQLAKLAEENRVAQWREETKKSILDRSEAIKQEAAAVGVQGAALRTLRIEQELLNSARAKNIKLTDNDREKIAQSADILGQQEYNTVTRPKAVDDTARLHAEKMRQLEVEKNAIYLTGQALTEYQYKQELINNQIQAGVAIKDIDIGKIDAQAAAYGKVSEAIEKQKQQLADAKEVVGGFFTDMMNGARNGQSALKAFGDAAVNALNRIIDKLMNKFLDQFLSGLLGGMSSGGISAADKTVNATVANNASIFAKGGSFGHAQPFAKGGTFTNSVVSKATPFMFADGGSFGASLGVMGEKTPEAVMPLKRGANGSLGVQVHGGNAKPSVRMGDITQVFRIEGAMTSEDVIGMVRQGSAAAVEQTRRDLQSMLEQLDADGKLQ